MIVNRLADVTFRQTTALLAASAVRLGEKVVIAEVDSVTARTSLQAVELLVHGKSLPEELTTSQQVAEVAQHSSIKQVCCSIVAGDHVLIRTNPGRDPQRVSLHEAFLKLMAVAQENGVNVVNSPTELLRFASKSSLLKLDPKHRPEMIVSANINEVAEFVRSAPTDCIIKPLRGSRGISVVRVSRDQTDLHRLISETFSGQAVVAQHFVDADHPGDRRVVTLDGAILESKQGIAGIERHPALGEFRANLHAGGTAHPLKLKDNERETATAASAMLLKHGIRLAGIDMVGDKIIEFNVFSTGGLFDSNRFANTDFSQEIIQAIL